MKKFVVKRAYLFFLFPAFVLYTLVVIYPMITAFPYSLTRWSGLGSKEFVGLENFIFLFTAPIISAEFIHALRNNILVLAMVLFIEIPFVIVLGYFIFRKIKGHHFLQLIILSPYFLNITAFNFLVSLAYSPRFGIFGEIIRSLGFLDYTTPAISYETKWALIFLMLMRGAKGAWGYGIVLSVANYHSVPTSLDEAACIDGAGELQRFRYIYLPFITPTILNLGVLCYVSSISMFDLPFMLGGQIGGVNKSMDTVAQFFYRQAFMGYNMQNSMGLGSTTAVVMLVIILIGAIIQIKLLRHRQIEQ